MEYLNRSRLPVFTPRLDLTAEDLNAQAETLCAAINELAGRLYIIKDMIPAEQRSQYAEEESYPILDEIKKIWDDIQRAWETIAQNKEECESHYQETLDMIQALEDRLNIVIENVRIELLATIDAIDTKHDNEEERIESKFDTEMTDLETRFNALDDAAARKSDVAALLDRIQYIQDNSIPRIGTDGYWYIGKIKTNTLAQGPQGPQGIQGPQGVQGPQGEPAKINGNNVINIVAGQDVTLQQDGNNFRIDCSLRPDVGSTIDASLNSTNYVLTLKLKNSAGTVLSTSTIDLPIENVVVSGRYDSQSKTIILELVSGGTIAIPVGGLVSGLQTEITSQNKLDSDLVDDTNSTNKFVSSSDKTAWNSKYDKPLGGIPSTDLDSSVQASLGKADTAVQDVSDKQSIIQYATMPVANSTNVGKIYQYVGATTNDYTQGYFYICINNSGVYSWENIDIQNDCYNNETIVSAGLDYDIGISDNPIDLTTLKKGKTFILNAAFRKYIYYSYKTNGSTVKQSLTLQKNYKDENSEWREVCIDIYEEIPEDLNTSSLEEYSIIGTLTFRKRVSTEIPEAVAQYNILITKSNNIKILATSLVENNVSQNELKEVNTNVIANQAAIESLNGKVMQYSTMPTANADYLGKVFEYIGATDSTYTQGYFYICVENNNVYSWEQLNVQPSSGGSDYVVNLDMPMQASDLPFTCSANDQAKIEAICDAYDADNTILNKYLIINTKYGFNIDYGIAQQMKVFTVYSINSSQVVFRSNSYVKAISNSTYNYTDIVTQYISVTYTRSTGTMTVSTPSYSQYGFKDRAYTAAKNLTVPQYSSMPTADSNYNGQIVQYKGATDQDYTNGYFYICNNSGGSYAWHQLNVQPSSSQAPVPIYNYVSGSSSTDYGTSTSSSAVNGRINLSSLAKGLHVFQNYSTGTALIFKYMKTGASSYTNDSLNNYKEPISNNNSSFKTFTIEVIEDMSSGLDRYAANTTLAIVTFYESNNIYSWKYKISVNNSSSNKGVQKFLIEGNANTTYMKSAYTTANSASSTASQAAQQASTNASAITALDTRVTALEQGGGGGGGDGKTEYISDAGGTPYPPSTMWSTSSKNNFNFEKNTAEFKEGSMERINVSLNPDQMYSDKINVNINYNYSTAMTDTSDVVIPNVTLKLYSNNDDSELTSIDVGDVTLVYDSMSNAWSFDKYNISFTSIMSGQNVYCKMFYGNGGSSSEGSISITEIITKRPEFPNEYYLDTDKIKSICSGKSVRFHILPSELQNINMSFLSIKDDSSSSYRINDFDSMTLGYLDIVCDEDSAYGAVKITGIMALQSSSSMVKNSYKMYIEQNNGMSNYYLWSHSWNSVQ